jgi:pimeloyl-ACP methyl ester carboxylesterase
MHEHIKHVTTRFGDIAYTEQGDGLPALFVHGVFLNGYLWRHVIDQVADLRRCIAVDLLGHGATRTILKQDVSWSAQADMLADFCDALGLDTIDLVGNDSGGGIAQIFATRYNARLRSLTLTNCDVHTNCPPPALRPLIDVSEKGNLGNTGRAMLADPNVARQILGMGYEHPERLSEETIRTYLQPIFGSQEHTQLFEQLFDQWFVRMDTSLSDIEPELHTLQTPTLVAWGTGDVFFDVEWAYWLRDTIPGARDAVLLDGARLFFPEERPTELVKPLREHWTLVASH